MRDAHTCWVWVPWRTFVEVCRVGSLSAAAASLGYTQSAISRQMIALERELGVTLLTRTARGVHPSVAGAALLPHARLIIGEAERARVAATTADQTRHLLLGAVPSAALGFLPRALRQLPTAWRWTMLTGLTPQLTDHVETGRLDLAVVTDAPPGLPRTADVTARHLFDDVMGVVLPADHPIARRRRVSFQDLADELWVEDNPGSEALLYQLAARYDRIPQVDRSSCDLMTKIALVAAGCGVALAPRTLSPALRPDVRFVALTAAPRRGVYATTRLHRDDLEPVMCVLRGQATQATGARSAHQRDPPQGGGGG